MKIRLMIVDDHYITREGLKMMLERNIGFDVVGIAENGQDILDKLTSMIDKPDLVLMDIRMPIMDGVECTMRIKREYPQIKVLILTNLEDDEYVIDALRSGADGYILKNLPIEKIVTAIKDVYTGNAVMQPEVAAKVISTITAVNSFIPDYPRLSVQANTEKGVRKTKLLSKREREILKLVAREMSNSEIADQLFLTEGTIKNYISSIYEKLGINHRNELIVYAIENKYA